MLIDHAVHGFRAKGVMMNALLQEYLPLVIFIGVSRDQAGASIAPFIVAYRQPDPEKPPPTVQLQRRRCPHEIRRTLPAGRHPLHHLRPRVPFLPMGGGVGRQGALPW
jgi:hypothetical protein